MPSQPLGLTFLPSEIGTSKAKLAPTSGYPAAAFCVAAPKPRCARRAGVTSLHDSLENVIHAQAHRL